MVHFFASLLHMAIIGGTGAVAFEDRIHNIFAKNGLLHLPDFNFGKKNWADEKNNS